ncbi:UNVERIFIED_CONTAM: hypothetical protein K2H54_044098 [Gekko kuhli]
MTGLSALEVGETCLLPPPNEEAVAVAGDPTGIAPLPITSMDASLTPASSLTLVLAVWRLRAQWGTLHSLPHPLRKQLCCPLMGAPHGPCRPPDSTWQDRLSCPSLLGSGSNSESFSPTAKSTSDYLDLYSGGGGSSSSSEELEADLEPAALEEEEEYDKSNQANSAEEAGSSFLFSPRPGSSMVVGLVGTQQAPPGHPGTPGGGERLLELKARVLPLGQKSTTPPALMTESPL